MEILSPPAAGGRLPPRPPAILGTPSRTRVPVTRNEPVPTHWRDSQAHAQGSARLVQSPSAAVLRDTNQRHPKESRLLVEIQTSHLRRIVSWPRWQHLGRGTITTAHADGGACGGVAGHDSELARHTCHWREPRNPPLEEGSRPAPPPHSPTSAAGLALATFVWSPSANLA